LKLVQGIVTTCLFLVLLCAIEHRFRKSKLPYLCWMVLFGVAYGLLQVRFFNGMPELSIQPDVILYIFLPILIFDSTRKIKLKAALKVAVPSFLLASAGLLVSMFVMAFPITLATDIPWIEILLFTGIMSATDPVAVSAIFNQFPVPGRLRTLIDGESLLNDGTTVILFSLLSKRIFEGQALSLEQVTDFFILSVGAAVLIGAGAGWAVAWLLKRWKALDDHFVGPMLPLLVVYLVFCLVQHQLDFSGVIAAMFTTMTMRFMFLCGWVNDMPPLYEMKFYQNLWDFLGSLANAVLFFILGVEIGAHFSEFAWELVLVALLAMLIARSAVVYGFGGLFNLFGFKLPLKWLHMLNLGGLKGALSVALILMLPPDYAYRNTFLCGALTMCMFTLIANTLATRAYLERVELPASPT